MNTHMQFARLVAALKAENEDLKAQLEKIAKDYAQEQELRNKLYFEIRELEASKSRKFKTHSANSNNEAHLFWR